jgi:hypothetical protein
MLHTWWAGEKRSSAAARRRPAPRVEALEDRLLLDAAWAGYAHDPQHTAISAVASQSLDAVRWHTPVDLNPQYSGGDLLIHYGSPLVTPSNTVLVPVKTGATGGFRVEGHNGGDGALLWSQPTDYLLPPPHNWVPSFSPTLTPTNRLYYPGAGGTVYVLDNPDSTTPSSPTQLAFYGIENYNPSTFNNSVYINTPITADAAGNIYFGFQVTTGTAPLGLRSGIARIDPTGHGTWIAASAAATDTAITKVVHNNAPALSHDGSVLYVAVNNGTGRGFGAGYLLALDSGTLAPLAKVRLKDPVSASDANLPDDGTSSPTVGPDGDVYFGVLESPFATSKGWLLHFSGDLSQLRSPPGAFGWDDTVSIVASSLVPSYHGASTYLLMTKYNNYADSGGDGVNKIAILDPNDTEVDPRTHATVMKEVLSIAGQTPDPSFIATHPNAVREWCINTAAVDPFTKSVLANSEDGKLYRWDLTTNTFTQVITLTTATGEAYTPTVIGVDGTVYAVNNATLFAVKRAAPWVTAATPSGEAFGTVGSARVTFNEAIDVSTFLLDQVHSFTRTVGASVTDLRGALLAVTPVVGSDGHSFDITFAPQSALGNYRLVLGPDVRDLAGRAMDQNGNGILGEVPGDQYTVHFALDGPKIIASTPTGTNHLPGEAISFVTVTFNEPIDPATFTPDKVWAFRGPNGFLPVTGVAPVAGSNDTQFRISFAALYGTGSYTMLIGPDVRDLAGHRMDQDGNFVDGEFPGDMYVASFGIQGLRVTGSNVTGVNGFPNDLRLTFNEPVDAAGFTPDQLTLYGPTGSVPVRSVLPVAGSNFTQFDVLFDPPTTAGTYGVTLLPYVQDLYGNYLDQDNSLNPAPNEATDSFRTSFTVLGPRVTATSPTGTVALPVDHLRVTFDRPMALFTLGQVTSFTRTAGGSTTDLLAALTGVTAVPFTNDTQFDITFATQGAIGSYTLTLAPDITDIYGNAVGTATTASFALTGGPHVLSFSPTGSVSGPVDHVRVTFDRAIDPASFGPAQVSTFLDASGQPIAVTGVVEVDGTGHTQFDILFAPQSAPGSYTLTLSPDITDLFGNPLTESMTQLVANGGFESGSFSGWTRSGNLSATGVGTVSSLPSPGAPHSGSYAAYFGPTGSLGYIAQTLATTPGVTYTLSFWLAHPYSDTGMGTEWLVSVGGMTLMDVTDAGNFGYTQFTFTFTATSSSTVLQFGFLEPPSYFFLDDVSVTPNSGSLTDHFTIT